MNNFRGLLYTVTVCKNRMQLAAARPKKIVTVQSTASHSVPDRNVGPAGPDQINRVKLCLVMFDRVWFRLPDVRVK